MRDKQSPAADSRGAFAHGVELVDEDSQGGGKPRWLFSDVKFFAACRFAFATGNDKGFAYDTSFLGDEAMLTILLPVVQLVIRIRNGNAGNSP